jgi:DNA-binding HxlR family transcriptional regulator
MKFTELEELIIHYLRLRLSDGYIISFVDICLYTDTSRKLVNQTLIRLEKAKFINKSRVIYRTSSDPAYSYCLTMKGMILAKKLRESTRMA